jgi:hypothetical protein
MEKQTDTRIIRYMGHDYTGTYINGFLLKMESEDGTLKVLHNYGGSIPTDRKYRLPWSVMVNNSYLRNHDGSPRLFNIAERAIDIGMEKSRVKIRFQPRKVA